MKEQVLRIIGISFIIMFFSLYLIQLNNYSGYAENQKNILTNEAIKRFEEDVHNGVEIDEDNYLVKEKNYNNSFTHIGMKLSSFIENKFNKTMNRIFRNINSVITDNQ